ncbi:choline ABC transporter substrate-binding protein (plasmid) [Rhizobium sp. CB3171]|uniref:choline ABC transporter substrate-binding protein n=1 Tax=unclassified Rhizobium TaxID=2613769 RepID=UPI000CDF3718|nr:MULTISPECIES: choline ABC transporter substrate-binding protein [Rhizobium]AVA26546.1 proline/glycine betaine ABC transporter substrate-binding protein [Rhizobium sp. NXC24]UWU24170.1 choline ABC transporter substrate-binding protein [Rhizobium tropici]WFU05099.1 choline ABC transporter substrate-binding protein [Rhizobium sp. CB3171]
MLKYLIAAGVSLLSIVPSISQAAEPESCKQVRFSDVGWTDITSTTSISSIILEALGYQPKSLMLSIPVTYASLKNKEIDVYLGDWEPAMVQDRKPYIEDKSIFVVGPNLEGAKYTLAVPKAAFNAGVKDFADLQNFSDKFDRKIYGIEAGSTGNNMIQSMIEKNEFGLKGWELIESSEQGMLAQVDRQTKQGGWIVFLGWEPHPMNTKYDMAYLTGGDATFGPNYGGATVYTNIRSGFMAECPNASRFLQNLKFSLTMENEIMGAILNQGADPKEAAGAWLKAHPEVVKPWLEGVTTFEGKPALDAVERAVKS